MTDTVRGTGKVGSLSHAAGPRVAYAHHPAATMSSVFRAGAAGPPVSFTVSQMVERTITSASVHQLERDGVLVIPEVIPSDRCDELLSALITLDTDGSRRRGGVRDLFAVAPLVRELAASAPFRRIVDTVLSPSAFPVRAILFDKTPRSNWHVAWHQDVTIAVSDRMESLEGFGPWSSKAGITHVQPPSSVLEQMVTLRLHLDPCGPENAALQVIPGSHRNGISTDRPDFAQALVCPVPRGGVLVMHPLLWHCSGKAQSASHRRVVHLEYADAELPEPLRWYERR